MPQGTGSNREIVAYITLSKDRVQGGKQLTLLAADEEEMERLAVEIAKAFKADVTRLSVGDYMIYHIR